MSFIDEIQSLDTSNPGGWPSWIKLMSVLALMVAIGAGGYFLKIKDQVDELAKKESLEKSAKMRYQIKQQKASQLPAYKAQLKEMKIILNTMLKQLPSKNEMSELIIDVSQTALASGIDNELFEPGAETLKDFYAEKAIKLRMVGKYHQFGKFVSGVASLPRVVILIMHDISLRPVSNGESGVLVLEGTANTYRYLDEDEQAEMDEQLAKQNKEGQ